MLYLCHHPIGFSPTMKSLVSRTVTSLLSRRFLRVNKTLEGDLVVHPFLTYHFHATQEISHVDFICCFKWQLKNTLHFLLQFEIIFCV
jgi:hypothetical protein